MAIILKFYLTLLVLLSICVFAGTSTATDIITITRADYNSSKDQLKVEATDSEGGNVSLTVLGYGQMSYNSKKRKPGRVRCAHQ